MRCLPTARDNESEEYRFEWTLSAPWSSGDFTTDWRMLRNGQEFGEHLGQEVAVRCNVVTLLPVADAFVTENLPYSNWGAMPHLRVRDDDSSASRYSFLRFDLSAISGDIVGATLRLRTRHRAIPSIGLYSVDDMVWSEGSVTWSNWQDGGATPRWLGAAYSLVPDSWQSLEVLGGVMGGAVVDFGIASAIDEIELDFWSRDSLYTPVLEITLDD